jgi:hypothetical protein
MKTPTNVKEKTIIKNLVIGGVMLLIVFAVNVVIYKMWGKL